MAHPQSLKVAVIGAGVSGLRMARELQKEGRHEVVIFEKSNQTGGIWTYTPEVEEEDLLGLNPNRKIVHTSLYASLRANLPRCLMGFTDYPFRLGKDVDNPMKYPVRVDVTQFLKDFVRDFGLQDLIRFNTEVVRVQPVNIPFKDDQLWVIESRTTCSDEEESSIEVFDAVVICNGHNTQPKLAKLAGVEKWPGKQIHSHNYRVPEPFRDQVVVVIGFGPSTVDIAIEVGKVAKEVHISTRGMGVEKAAKIDTLDNVWLHSEVDYCSKNGEVTFRDGSSVAVDTIIHCTGYKYSYPFLKTNGIVTVDDNRVGPLYKHVFPPQLAPRLSFVGIPKRSINFLMMDLQAKWVAHVLSGKALLPSKEEMLADVEKLYKQMELDGVPKHHTHTLPFEEVGKYLGFLSKQVGYHFDGRLGVLFVDIAKEIGACWIGFRDRIEKWKF